MSACSMVHFLSTVFSDKLFFLLIIPLGLCKHNRAKQALNLVQRMSVEPNEYIFSSVFKICAQLADEQSLNFGEKLFNTMPIKFQNNPIVLTSALHMFVQCGDISAGEKLFSRIEKNKITYSAMMMGKELHSYCSIS